MSICMRWLVLGLVICTPVGAADFLRHVDPGPGVTDVQPLVQNWTDAVSNDFYNMPQGSRLLPYDWFLHLEQAGSETKFRDNGHIRSLGYIPRMLDLKNPDGLPIGFIDDAPYEGGIRGLGMTCAACHTSLIKHGTTAYLIDGGPTLADFEKFQTALAAALAATDTDAAKFQRFVAKVLPAGASDSDKLALHASLHSAAAERLEYNHRNLPAAGSAPFGPGRVDAFGAIFNEVTVTFLGVPTNHHVADAPVSYPCLWDTPQHDFVQWNGAAENKETLLSIPAVPLFGTKKIGALGRNAGEVLGVFGHAEVNLDEPLHIPRRYPSTVKTENLIQIEKMLTTLWSPQWPTAVMALDSAKVTRGAVIYENNCKSCHAHIDRKQEGRKVKANIQDVETDQQLIKNFGNTANTGRLQGRKKSLLALGHFGPQAQIGEILKHVVERVILKPILPEGGAAPLLALVVNGNHIDLADAFNPGYQMSATIEIGDRKLVGRFDSLSQLGDRLRVKGGHFQLIEPNQPLEHLLNQNLIDLRHLDGVNAAKIRLSRVDIKVESLESDLAEIVHGKAKIGYKARPLNGIWATAPYLHNGSVPTLAELLKPESMRNPTFHVGSTEFDPVNVGFKDDSTQPLFDTSKTGNSNKGHNYTDGLVDTDRDALLEYLKSL